MSKLDAFILAQEKRHNFIVSEIKQSEQRTIDEFVKELDKRIIPIEVRLSFLEKWKDYLCTLYDGATKGLIIATKVITGLGATFVFYCKYGKHLHKG